MVGSRKNNPASSRGKGKVSVAEDSGEALVGARIRVWWPLDRQFYEGVVASYASSKKQHRVLYDDGDVENLDLYKQRWELIEEKDAVAKEDESADEGSEATPELKSKARSGKISDDGEEETEKQKSGVKNLEKSKDVEKKSPKPETERNGKMGNIGGKIVAAASRMSGRFRSKENGHAKETPKALKSSKEVSESKKPKQIRSLASSGSVRSRTSAKRSKRNYTDVEGGDAADEEAKHKALESSAEAVSEDTENETYVNDSKQLMKSNDAADDDSNLLVSFLKKSPGAVQALMEKRKGKKEKEGGEGSTGKDNEVEEKA